MVPSSRKQNKNYAGQSKSYAKNFLFFFFFEVLKCNKEHFFVKNE